MATWEEVVECAGRHIEQDLNQIDPATPETIQTAYEITQWLAENEMALYALAAACASPLGMAAVAALLACAEEVATLILAIVVAFGIWCLIEVVAWLATCAYDPAS